ncbi:MAG: outer membrane beta-barrel protein [Eudoraea sp.]|nr:outer membrane beta-barrel protein [Eudoraea sp.]
MKHFLIVFLLFGTLLTHAQDRNWSVDISYPFSVQDKFGSSNQGIVGAGLKYRFKSVGKLRLGASLDATWFSTTIINDSDPIQEFPYRDFFFQPRLFAELPLTRNNRLRFSGGIGWTWSRSINGPAFFDEFGQVQNGGQWYNGFNLNLGMSYDISSRVFFKTQYDQIFLSVDTINRNVGLIKLGAGFRF